MLSAFIAHFGLKIGLQTVTATDRKVAYNTEAQFLDAEEQGFSVFHLNYAFLTHF